MDPATDLPAATVEPPVHTAHAANPTPTFASTHNHPPYAEMITAAIAALKDKNGSSRQAIAKYIEKEYSNLPPSHASLLTQHLKRLKISGHLLMVKHSYALPGSLPVSPPGPPSSSGLKKRPGRPPKFKPEVQPNGGGGGGVGVWPEVQVDFDVGPEAQLSSGVGPEVHPNGGGEGPEAVLVSLGLVDEAPPPLSAAVAKRGRGRPPKAKTGSVVAGSGGPSLGKRGRGRPARPKLLSVQNVLMGYGVPKRGRGRPPRSGPPSVAGSGKPRGRPKRVAASRVGRPRGRPSKNVGVHGGVAYAPIDAAGGVLQAKRPGRPPKAGGAKKPRKLSGRPLGRPKKDASVMAIQASLAQQLTAYQDLKSKFEHVQSKIKLAVGVVKPYLNHEFAVNAIGALQELEELATMDVNAPLNVQVQEPLPQN